MTTWSQPAGMAPTSSTSTSTVDITDDGAGNITAVRTYTSADEAGVPPCTLQHRLGADNMSATLKAGQSCPGKNDFVTSFTSNSWAISASGYVSASAFRSTGTNAMGMSQVGSGTSMATCTRM
jgi:hypothetical protein